MASDCTKRDIISLQGLLPNRASSSVNVSTLTESFHVWVCLHTPTNITNETEAPFPQFPYIPLDRYFITFFLKVCFMC